MEIMRRFGGSRRKENARDSAPSDFVAHLPQEGSDTLVPQRLRTNTKLPIYDDGKGTTVTLVLHNRPGTAEVRVWRDGPRQQANHRWDHRGITVTKWGWHNGDEREIVPGVTMDEGLKTITTPQGRVEFIGAKVPQDTPQPVDVFTAKDRSPAPVRIRV